MMKKYRKGGGGVFGYVKPYLPELRVREEATYRALYCGLCRTMKKTVGRLSTLSLSYDFVFFLICRLRVANETPTSTPRRCIAHPFRRRPMTDAGEIGKLAARISALLTYDQLRDDLRDRGFKKRLRARLLLPIFKHAKRRANLPDLDAEFRRCLDSLDSLERENNPSCDAAAETFGSLLGAAFAYGLDGADARVLFEIGRHTGRFVYVADAADDYDDDRRRGNYNPLVVSYGGRDLTPEEKNALHTSLVLELTALERAVALLPPKRGDLSEITDNILYIGLVRRIAYLTADPTQERDPDAKSGGETE